MGKAYEKIDLPPEASDEGAEVDLGIPGPAEPLPEDDKDHDEPTRVNDDEDD